MSGSGSGSGSGPASGSGSASALPVVVSSPVQLSVSPCWVDFRPLVPLQDAKDSDTADVESGLVLSDFIVDCFRLQFEGLNSLRLEQWGRTLTIQTQQANQLFVSLTCLLRLCVYNGLSSADEISSLFPADFPRGLKQRLSNLIASNSQNFREQMANNTTAPPKLVDFDWRVDLKTSSGHLSRMRVPTIFLSLSLENQPQVLGCVPDRQHFQLELSKQALGTMLTGLEKIREQLAGMQQ